MVVECVIEFDNNPNGVFVAGQTLSGQVTLTFTKQTAAKGGYGEVGNPALRVTHYGDNNKFVWHFLQELF